MSQPLEKDAGSMLRGLSPGVLCLLVWFLRPVRIFWIWERGSAAPLPDVGESLDI